MRRPCSGSTDQGYGSDVNARADRRYLAHAKNVIVDFEVRDEDVGDDESK